MEYRWLSRQKAEDVQNKVKDSDYIIIAADTVVAVDDNILGKPKDKDDAFNMIKLIEGRNHSVYTGVTLLKKDRENVTVRTFYEETVVEVYPMTEEEIYSYLDFNQWEDKAGGYGIQGSFAAYVKAIKGDYYTVVGLPISRIIYEDRSVPVLEIVLIPTLKSFLWVLTSEILPLANSEDQFCIEETMNSCKEVILAISFVIMVINEYSKLKNRKVKD